MSIRKKIRLKGKTLASRLTGISCPIGGISWSPPANERDIAKRLLTFLEDRRVLYQPYHLEVGPHVVQSVLEIRERLTADLENIKKTSVLAESLSVMRASCRRFCTLTEHPAPRHYFLGEGILMALGELRAMFGLHLARLACAYNLEIENDLASILPPEPEEKLKPAKKAKKRQGK